MEKTAYQKINRNYPVCIQQSVGSIKKGKSVGPVYTLSHELP